MFRIMNVLVLACLTVAVWSQDTAWVVQNIYRLRGETPTCMSYDLLQTTSWRNNTCQQSGPSTWVIRGCNSSGVVTAQCSDAECTPVNCNVTAVFPANRCGIIAQGNDRMGLYFGCALMDPPVLSNQDQDVFNERTFVTADTGDQCSANDIFLSQSTRSSACIFGEKRTCLPTTPFAQYAIPCNSSLPVSVTVDKCVGKTISGVGYYSRTDCAMAINKTNSTDPIDPIPPPEDLAPCEDAVNEDQCMGLQKTPSNNKFTLSGTDYTSKCCVWCGADSDTGRCITPSWGDGTCACPSTSNKTDSQLLSDYQCPSTTLNITCRCTGKPPGAYPCSATALSAVLVMWLLIAVSLVLA